MTVVAISAAYGAGGTVVGPELAKALGVEFVDRAIPLAVAARLEVPVDDAEAHDEETASTSWLDRILRGFTNTDSSVPAPMPAETFTSEDFRQATEDVLLCQADTGHGVILGRASAVVLRDRSEVLRVRLDGPRERRTAQAMALGGLDREAAESALQRFDRTHAEYARRFYGADIRDPALYHVLIDSTAVELSACVEILALAARSLSASV